MTSNGVISLDKLKEIPLEMFYKFLLARRAAINMQCASAYSSKKQQEIVRNSKTRSKVTEDSSLKDRETKLNKIKTVWGRRKEKLLRRGN